MLQELKHFNIDPSMLDREERIICAAMHVFSYHPYEEASIRMIAKLAKVSISSILDYFENKEKLYHAVFDRIRPPQKFILDKKISLSLEEAKVFLVDFLDEFTDGMYRAFAEGCCSRVRFFGFFFMSPLYEKYSERAFLETQETLPRLVKILTGNNDRQKAYAQSVHIVEYAATLSLGYEGPPKGFGFIGFSEEEILKLKHRVILNSFSLLGVDPPFALKSLPELIAAPLPELACSAFVH